MSVRRLAEIAVQPPTFAFSDALSGEVRTWMGKYPEGRQQSAVIPLLMLAQEQEGWITKAAIEAVADMLSMPYIRALEVATFYTQFQLKPVGAKAHVQVCGTTPCMLRGSEALMDVCRDKIHHDQFHLNAAGTLSWEEVECLGACVNAPMVMIFKDTYEDLTPEGLGAIIDAFEQNADASVTPGPQNGRFVSTPISGQTTLLDEQVFIDAAGRRRSGETTDGTASSGAAGGTDVPPPSKAARPATDAPETNGAIKSPSPVKAKPSEEDGSESEVPAHDAKAADKGEPAVEGGDKNRERPKRGAGEATAYRAPELGAKPGAGESGKTTGSIASEPSPANDLIAGGTQPQTDAPPDDVSKFAAGVDDVGTSMGSAVAPKLAVPATAPPAAVQAHPGGSFVVSVSNSNTPRLGDDEVVAEPEGGDAGAVASEAAPLGHPDRPPRMARPEQPDDLKLISGIGSKIEAILHSLGIFTFRQVAAWSEAERYWVDGYLNFHGRIERDNWIGQAGALAAGGEDEYVRVFGRKPH